MAGQTTDNISLTTSGGIHSLKSFFESDGGDGSSSAHYQLMGLGFANTAATWDIASATNPYPFQLSATSTVGTHITNLNHGMTLTGGITAFNVKLLDNAGLTVNAIVSDLVIGITTNRSHESSTIGVYGTGGTAVGMTGSVYIINTDNYLSKGIGIFGTGGAMGGSSVSGDVGVTGYVGIDPTTYIAVYGATGYGSSVSGDVGVTGSVAIDHRSVIGISGGITVDIMPTLVVAVPSGLTSGYISSNLGGGITLDPHGLSSGVRIQAFSTGSTSEYVYVSYGTGGHATAAGYALREFDSVFIEIDNTSKVTIRSDNSAASIRYIGS
tara:strand:+ start:782 stop:1756 length:975 start_codon:yes stop_codon:yes gene_type:complete